MKKTEVDTRITSFVVDGPNLDETWDHFSGLVCMDVDLTGLGFVNLGRGVLGMVTEMWRVDPARVTVRGSPPRRYEVRVDVNATNQTLIVSRLNMVIIRRSVRRCLCTTESLKYQLARHFSVNE